MTKSNRSEGKKVFVRRDNYYSEKKKSWYYIYKYKDGSSTYVKIMNPKVIAELNAIRGRGKEDARVVTKSEEAYMTLERDCNSLRSALAQAVADRKVLGDCLQSIILSITRSNEYTESEWNIMCILHKAGVIRIKAEMIE